MKKFARIFVKSLAWFTGILVSLTLVAGAMLYLYKDQIIDLTLNELNKYLCTKVIIDPDIEFSIIDKFPQVYLKFKDVKIYESIPESDKLLGEMQSVYVTFDVLSIWNGKYEINHIYLEHGKVHLFVDAQGNNNYNIVKSSTDKNTPGVNFHLQRIILTDVAVRYENLLTKQDHQLQARSCSASVHVENEQYRIGIKGDLHVQSIHVNDFDYFTEKDVKLESEMLFSAPDSLFRILPSNLKVQDANFNVQGRYEFSHRNSIDLSVSAGQSNVHTLISLLPASVERGLRDYRSQGQVYFDAQIHGIVSDTENPKVDINFGFSRASIYHPSIPYRIEYANMKGHFTNGEERKAKTWSLQLDSLSGYLAGRSFKGNFILNNFDHPYVKFNLETTQEVKSLLAFYPNSTLSAVSGEVEAKVHFEGNLEDLQDKNRQDSINAYGDIILREVNFKVKDYAPVFKNFNGTFTFLKNDVSITGFTGMIGTSDFQLNGTFKNVLAKIIYDKGQTVIEAKLKSNYFNASEILKGNTRQTDSAYSRPVSLIPEGYVFDLSTEIGYFTYEKFTAKSLSGQLQYRSPVFKFSNFSYRTAGGKMLLNSRLDFSEHQKIKSSTQVELSEIRIDSIFYMCDEFSQDFITSANLRGSFTGKIDLLMHMDNQLNIDTKSIVAEIDASIKNGQLLDFAPMMSISKYIDEKELQNIKFSELKNKIYIKDELITIPEMLIKSSISTITVSGTHSFSNQLNYKLAIPLKNFTNSKYNKFTQEEKDGAIEEKTSGGATIYLMITGTSDNFKVSLDSKRTKNKIKEDLNKEKQEFKDAFKQQKQEIKDVQVEEEQYFDF